MTEKWSPNSWRAKKAKHIPYYQNEEELKDVLSKISKYPPLVFAGEARMLENKLAEVSKAKAFLLQGGDCAESF